jgi:hypothetical protein
MKAKHGLLAIGVLALVAGFGATEASAQQGAKMFAVLEGQNEVPGPGDVDGHGAASLLFRGPNFTQVCATIIVSGIGNPTLAHIHRGFASQANPPLVNLPIPAAGNPGTSSGCVVISAALSAQIRALRYGFYVNVHNAAFPGGAVRGQLF